MKACEKLVSENSEYFIYSPSKLAQELFLYPTRCGRFSYLPGYHLVRQAFDSFLLIYVQSGMLELEYEGERHRASEGQFVLLDCYKRHGYGTSCGAVCLWCHFDGISAKRYYEAAVSNLGVIFSLPDPNPAVSRLLGIIKTFSENHPVREPLLSKYLTDIFTEFLLFSPKGFCGTQGSITEEAIAYIGEHFREKLMVETLADRAGMSLYQFIRLFKKESGFTPHDYLISVRIAAAKYLLKNSRLTVKEICYESGFSCESVFCNAFRRRVGASPGQYREGQGEPSRK